MSADAGLREAILGDWPGAITPVRAATGDAIYREDDAMLDGFRAEGCDIVNLESSHLFAASVTNAAGCRMRTIQCGVISDVVAATPGAEHESTLSEMLSGASGSFNPLERTGDIVQFYIETLAPKL